MAWIETPISNACDYVYIYEKEAKSTNISYWLIFYSRYLVYSEYWIRIGKKVAVTIT